MANIDEKPSIELKSNYSILVSLIENMQNRLKWSELAYIFLNIIVFFPVVFFTVSVTCNHQGPIEPLHLLSILCGNVIGISINTHWVNSSMRLQLRLKLRYFQARYLERKMNKAGETFFLDENLFFNQSIGKVKSPDGEETVFYPKKGMLRMDGFFASATPRVLSLLIPFVFFIIYVASFLTVLISQYLHAVLN